MSGRDIVVAIPRRATGDNKRTMDATRHLSLSRSLSVAVWPPAHLMLSSLTKLKRDFRLCFLCLLFSSFFRLCLISCRGTCYQSYFHVALVFAYIDGQAIRMSERLKDRRRV